MFYHVSTSFHHCSTSFRMFTPGHSKVALETPRTHPARCPLMSGHHRSLGDGYGSKAMEPWGRLIHNWLVVWKCGLTTWFMVDIIIVHGDFHDL